jgi:hypothetical protein
LCTAAGIPPIKVVQDFAGAAAKIEMMPRERFPRWDGVVERPEVTQKDDGYRVTSSSAQVLSHVAVPSRTPRLQIEVPRASSLKRASPQSPPGTASSSKRPRLGVGRKVEAETEGDSEERSDSESGEDEDEEDEEDEMPVVAPFRKVDLHWLTVDDGDPIAPKHFPPAHGQVRGLMTLV